MGHIVSLQLVLKLLSFLTQLAISWKLLGDYLVLAKWKISYGTHLFVWVNK